MLSKSKYIRGKQCPLSLWYRQKRYTPDPEITKNKFNLFTQGNRVGELAKQYFQNDDPVDLTDIPSMYLSATKTKTLTNAQTTTIFEAAAVCQKKQIGARIDILKAYQGSYHLIEVKSSVRIKEYQLEDLAFQYHTFKAAGYPISHCFLMLPNSGYILKGDMDPTQLFTLHNVTKKVLKRQTSIQESIEQLQIFQYCTHPPEIPMGKHCHKPFNCEYQNQCRTGNQQLNLLNTSYNQAIVEQTKNEQTNTLHIDKKAINTFLSHLTYPLFFLDYEVIMPIIPVYQSTHPFEQIPFQFSLHCLDSQQNTLEHVEFIHKQTTDPRANFVQALIKHCGSTGSIVTYNQQFESKQTKLLAKQFPAHQKFLNQMNNRMVDLMQPFKNKWVYHPKQKDSFSIKTILSTLTPLNYNNLEIADGQAAMKMYLDFACNNQPSSQMWDSLSQYCKLDSYAMVVILSKLFEFVDQKPII